MLSNTNAHFHSICRSDESRNFDDWRAEREAQETQFMYWNMVLRQEVIVLGFVGSIRVGDFTGYVPY